MREIKFRAFIKTGNKIRPVRSIYFDELEELPIEVADCGDLSCNFCVDEYSREDVELMQFTGIKDKNGVEIYEGDIVKADGEYGDILTGEIHYRNGCFMLREHTLNQIYNAEVIGNSYDNHGILQ